MKLNTQPPETVVKSSEVLAIHSIFSTIQGEGPFVGRRAVFVRLAGCNLQCPMCDTEYTSIRTPLSPEVIVDYVRLVMPGASALGQHSELVVITGGEPMRQPIAGLCWALVDAGFTVQVETNGTLYRHHLPFGHPKFAIVCSPKMHFVHPDLVPVVTAFKYVATKASLENSMDGLPTQALEHPLHNKILFRPPVVWDGEIFLQPVDEQDEEKNKANLDAVVASCRTFGYRLCLQVHKIIGVA